MYGRVVAVTPVPLGDELSADAASGASVLYVDDVADFNEDGGWLDLNGTRYEYASVDDDTSTITLTGTLSAAAVTGDRVNVWDDQASGGEGAVAVVYEADIETDDTVTGDPLQATVPHSLANRLVSAIRSKGSETVSLEVDGDDLRVVEVLGKDATLGDSSFIGEVGTAPPGEVGIFMFSNKISNKGQQVTTPVLQFNVGVNRDQPSIQSDTLGSANLNIYSGANVSGHETQVSIAQGQFFVGIESDADDELYQGAMMGLALDQAYMITKRLIGPSGNSKGVMQLLDGGAFFGYNNTANDDLRGFQYITSLDSARILSNAALEVVTQTGLAYQAVKASAFTVSSDADEKTDLQPVTGALEAIAALTAYDYQTPNGAAEGETVKARGVMAQDVKAALGDEAAPVMNVEAGTLGVDLYALLTTAVAAIQELTARVADLEANTPKGAQK